MAFTVKKVFTGVIIVVLAAIQSGCGESGGEDGITAPIVTLNALKVTSSTASTHAHSVSIPFTDVSSAPASGVSQYRSDTVNGHSHVIALSQQQIIDLNDGMQLNLTSSAPSSGSIHTHTWNIQGGSVLYEKNCFNCHSNNKRGQLPASNSKMGTSISFAGNQLTALINPAGATQSISIAAIPDPAYAPGTAPLDGAALYAGACASCHNPLNNTTKSNRTAAQISGAITNQSQMNSLSSLTAAQVQAIATALVK